MGANMESIIEVKNVTKKYGAFTAIDNLSLTVKKGDIFGFLGHNGAGKTTTTNILTTLLEPTNGSATIAGFDIITQSIDVRRNIGYVPENVQLYDTLSAYENLEFFARLSEIKHPKNAIDETLAFLQATSFAHKKIGELSKGMRQRIGLAQAIIHKPPVLFLDEPSAGLDPTGIRQLRDIILRLNKEDGTTIFMNTHLLVEVAKTCTAIGVLNHGKLIYMDTLANTLKRFQNEDSLEQIYFSIESDTNEK
jgi:ABC-2 type transport system ATP-binding protein